jgi:hypothetical protein
VHLFRRVGGAYVVRMSPQGLLQAGARPLQAGPNGTHRHLERFGRLLVRKSFDVDQRYRHPEGLRQCVDRFCDVLAQQLVDEFLLGIAPPKQERLMQLFEQ